MTAQAILCAFRIALAPLVAVILIPLAYASDRREYVPEIDVYHKLSEQTRLFVLASSAKVETTDSWKNQLGVHLDFTAKGELLHPADSERARDILVRFGYRQLRTWDGQREGVSERRGLAELTVQTTLPKAFRVAHRFGFDQRELSGESSQRYRYRFNIERKFNAARIVTSAYARAEVFYDTRYSAWSRERYQFGSEIDLTKHWRLEPYYARDKDSEPNTVYTDRIGMIVKLYLVSHTGPGRANPEVSAIRQPIQCPTEVPVRSRSRWLALPSALSLVAAVRPVVRTQPPRDCR